MLFILFMDINKLSKEIIGCAIEVHRSLGPGLLESAYEECLCHELKLQKINFSGKNHYLLYIKTKNLIAVINLM